MAFGPEIIINGAPEGSDGWTVNGNGASITDDAFTANGGLGAKNFGQNASVELEAGKTYRASFDVTEYTRGVVTTCIGGPYSANATALGHYEFDVTLPETHHNTLVLVMGHQALAKAKNFSVREVLPD